MRLPKGGNDSEPLNVTSYCPAQQSWTSDKATVTDSKGRQVLFMIDAPDDFIRNPQVGPMIHKGLIMLDNDEHAVRDFPNVPRCFSNYIEGWHLEGIRRCTGMIITEQVDPQSWTCKRLLTVLLSFMARMLPIRKFKGKILPLQTMAAFTNRMDRWRKAKNVTAWQEHGEESKKVKQFIIDQLPDPKMKTTESLVDLTPAQLETLYNLNRGKHGYRSRYEKTQQSTPSQTPAASTTKSHNEGDPIPYPAVPHLAAKSGSLSINHDGLWAFDHLSPVQQAPVKPPRQIKRGLIDTGEIDLPRTKKQRIFDEGHGDSHSVATKENNGIAHAYRMPKMSHGFGVSNGQLAYDNDNRYSPTEDRPNARYQPNDWRPHFNQDETLTPEYKSSNSLVPLGAWRLGHYPVSNYTQAFDRGGYPTESGYGIHELNDYALHRHQEAANTVDSGTPEFSYVVDNRDSVGSVPLSAFQDDQTHMAQRWSRQQNLQTEGLSLPAESRDFDYPESFSKNWVDGSVGSLVPQSDNESYPDQSSFTDLPGGAYENTTQSHLS